MTAGDQWPALRWPHPLSDEKHSDEGQARRTDLDVTKRCDRITDARPTKVVRPADPTEDGGERGDPARWQIDA